MILFYKREAEEIVLAAIVNHHNKKVLLKEYKDNKDILSISKLYKDDNFLRVGDFKEAILRTYNYPNWVESKDKLDFLKLVVAHKDIDTSKLIAFISNYLFSPEVIFHSFLDESVRYREMASEVIKELDAFRRVTPPILRNEIKFFDINPKHEIAYLFAEHKSNELDEPFIVLNGNSAVVWRAKELGMEKDVVIMSRFDAFKLRKVKKRPKLIATTIFEFDNR